MEQLSKVSAPVKIFGAGGLVLIVGLLGFTLLHKPRTNQATETVSSTTARTPVASAHPRRARPKPPAIHLASGLPSGLRTALLGHRIVVAVVSSGSDRELIKTARQASKQAHAGFAILNVTKELVAQQVATLASGIPSSSVLVVKRPGAVTVALPGYSDVETLVQAAIDAKR